MDHSEDLYMLSGLIEDDSDTITLMSTNEESSLEQEITPDNLSVLSLRNTVLLPGVIMPITVNRDKSIALVKEAYKNKELIGVVAQDDVEIEDPTPESLYEVGTVAKILKIFRMPEGNITVIIQGKKAFKLLEQTQELPYFKFNIESYPQLRPKEDNKEYVALVDSIKEISSIIIEKSANLPSEASFAVKNIESRTYLINFVISNMYTKVSEKQKLLEINSIEDRANEVLKFLSDRLELVELKNDIQTKVKNDIEKQQKEYYLNQQIKQIQQELGQDPVKEEIEKLEKKAKGKKWTKAVKEKFERSLAKFQRLNPQSAEYSIEHTYLETLIDLPWKNYSKDNKNIKKAKEILDQDHYGLKKVKERVLEHLSVIKLKENMDAPILCFYGPPGVGKTSLGKSIAKALGRKYTRISLGGLRDEAEIRGHRKTYIGAMPGRIVQNIKKVGTSNPVIMLDEIDKVGNSIYGDPSSALLEVLDPEQNNTFHDNYLEVDYDLSKVMFISTANDLSTIHPALLDRMEIINVSGYTLNEKLNIAKQYLLPKQIEKNGISTLDIDLSDTIIEKIISSYTRESGVRQLDLKISKIVRRIAKHIASEENYNKMIDESIMADILGVPHAPENYQKAGVPGVSVGLAWTSVGGDILFIETSKYKGKGKLSVTGNLGNVMKESANIALVYIKSNAKQFGIDSEVFEKFDFHLHVPEGATPKDGPSAGITIFSALVSLLTERKVKEKLAMTGEITLRGKVLPVGGIKEKVLAAKRANINTIMLCHKNAKDINQIEASELEGLDFLYVDNMQQVFSQVLD